MILAIYGAGGLGREVYELACSINRSKVRWEKIFFIDDSDQVEDLRDVPILKFEAFQKKNTKEDIEVCIAIGEPAIREKVFTKLVLNNIKLATLIHPAVFIPSSTKIGLGTIICNYVSITCDIDISENVYIHPMACIGHDALIGKSSIISSFVDIAGNCKIGCKAFLGINVILKQGISIGDNTIVGMGSVVHRDLPSSVIALGNPARPMKENKNERVFK